MRQVALLPLAVGVLCTSSAFLFPVNSLVSQPVSAHRRQLRPIRLAEKVSPFNTDPPSRTDWQLGQTKSFSWLVAWQTLQAFKGKQKALASLHWDTSNLTAQNLFVPSTLLFFQSVQPPESLTQTINCFESSRSVYCVRLISLQLHFITFTQICLHMQITFCSVTLLNFKTLMLLGNFCAHIH